jgi:cellulose synthase/poly-beta-1,6-N-acetylglucosamine synthase-like glycosyltransferase
MNALVWFLRVPFWLLNAAIGSSVGYLVFLAVQALRMPRGTAPPAGGQQKRFLVLIPAHDEEKLLPGLLASIARARYPQELLSVHVVADNCSDRTAEVAREHGAQVHERHNLLEVGKGYALQWLIDELGDVLAITDGVVVLDADSTISEGFFEVMSARLSRGERVIQAYYTASESDRSRSAALRAAALSALHFLRPLGRMAIGGSAGLKGNGMVFASALVPRYRWSASLTEDIELHLRMLLDGERVTFAPDAIVWSEMPSSLTGARSQNVRWERGRLEMARRYVPALLPEGIRRRSFRMIDAAAETAIPPFSILAGGSWLSLMLGFLLTLLERGASRGGARPGWLATQTVLPLGLIAGQLFYLLAGLHVSKAPAHVYRALLYAPALVLWKIWLYARVILGRDQQGWTRTARNEGDGAEAENSVRRRED